jgi:hypothetical protein
MHRCPQCNKPLPELVRRCPSCQADLDLLVDLQGQMRGKLDRAEALTRQGELGQAMWTYLEVLEADPGNPAARKQIAHVATAVRQFDLSSPARRWASGMPVPESWWEKQGKVVTAFVAALALGLLVGLVIGRGGKPHSGTAMPGPDETQTDKTEPKKADGKEEGKDGKKDAATKKDETKKGDDKKEPAKKDSGRIDSNTDDKGKTPKLENLLEPNKKDALDIRPKLGSPVDGQK